MRRIPLWSRSGQVIAYASVDDAVFPMLSKHRWHRNSCGYAVRRRKASDDVGSDVVMMHREVMRPPRDKIIDHINDHRTDNRKDNLRICGKSENAMHARRGRWRGTYKDGRRWKAQIKLKQKVVNLGRFNHRIDAARAYNKAAKKFFGKYARLNPV